MITKSIHPRGRPVLVTFELPASIWAERITLVGDFNDWDPTQHPLAQTRFNENWHITLALEPGRAYRFRYLIDGRTWSNDSQADGYTTTEDGLACSVVVTTEITERPPAAVPQPVRESPIRS